MVRHTILQFYMSSPPEASRDEKTKGHLNCFVTSTSAVLFPVSRQHLQKSNLSDQILLDGADSNPTSVIQSQQGSFLSLAKNHFRQSHFLGDNQLLQDCNNAISLVLVSPLTNTV